MERIENLTQLSDNFNATAFIIGSNAAKIKHDKVAIYYQDQKISYGDLQKEINKVGNALKSLGIEIENRIAILLPNCSEFISCLFGAMKIGAVPVTLNTMMTPKDYQYFLNDSRAKAIVVSSDMVQKIEGIRDNLDYLRYIIVVGGAKENQIDYYKLVGEAPSELGAAATFKDDVAYWQYTSGTTGLPKGVVHRHQDLFHVPGVFFKEIVEVFEEDVFFPTARLFFNLGLMVTVSGLYHRAGVILDPQKPTPERAFEIITKYRPTILSAVPTLYANMLIVNNISQYDLSSLRICLSAGEPLPPGLFKKFKDRFGIEILDGIGCTEASNWYIHNRPGRIKLGSTGEIVPECEVKIVNGELQELPRGEVGELMVKAESIASGYWNKHEMTVKTFIGGWLRTGDLFYQDEEGYFWFKGRVDDVMQVGGIKVIPTEVEKVLMEHPAVVECAVVSAPDEHGLTKPKAFIILSSAYQPSSKLVQELQEFVRTKMAPYNYPRWIEFVEELPKTATGKIQRFKLRNST
jgi:benzoate-CoA ligase family protein